MLGAREAGDGAAPAFGARGRGLAPGEQRTLAEHRAPFEDAASPVRRAGLSLVSADPAIEVREVGSTSLSLGASECGLQCDPRILALDKGNDPFYTETRTQRGQALDTRFPCR